MAGHAVGGRGPRRPRLLRALVLGTAAPAPLHLAAGTLYVLNPYVAVYADRTSVALLAYAALPWMLLCVHRGLRDPRGWWWPAAFALVLTSTGGGVNAAVTGWVLLAPALLVAYESAGAESHVRALVPWLGRLAVTAAVTSAWWVVPLLVHTANGVDFLPFTEQPGTIWGTTSLAESFRLMGFWTSYIGVGFGGELRPFSSQSPGLLFSTPIVLASMAVPALVVLSLRWTWRAPVRPVLPAADRVRSADDGRRLPGGHAAAARPHVHLQPGRGRPLPAHDLQGGAAGGARVRRASAASGSLRSGAHSPSDRSGYPG